MFENSTQRISYNRLHRRKFYRFDENANEIFQSFKSKITNNERSKKIDSLELLKFSLQAKHLIKFILRHFIVKYSYLFKLIVAITALVKISERKKKPKNKSLMSNQTADKDAV